MTKRANGEGSIRKKPNGHWELQIMDGWKPNGKRNIRSFSGRTQKKSSKNGMIFSVKRQTVSLRQKI